jgi:hypothetical protein
MRRDTAKAPIRVASELVAKLAAHSADRLDEMMHEGEEPMAAQKSRYPRSLSRFQSATSWQKANLLSWGKRKRSRSSSYTNPQMPLLRKYISVAYRSLAPRSVRAPRSGSGSLSAAWSIPPLLCARPEQKIPRVRRIPERRPHSSRPENPHSPGPIARGTRPGRSEERS